MGVGHDMLAISPVDLIFAMLLNLLLVVIARIVRVADTPGLIVAWVLGVAMLYSASAAGYVPFVVFVAGCALLTRTGAGRKEWMGLPAASRAAVSAGRILSCCLPPTIFAVATLHRAFQPSIFTVAVAGGFASAFGSIASTELGVLMNARPVLLLTMRRTYPGAEGAISMEGAVDGLAAACLMSLVAWIAGGVRFSNVWIVILAAIAGNLARILLGPILSGKMKHAGLLTDFFGTSLACVVALSVARMAQ